ncbi:hypothetical protein ACFY0A_46060 [Streptomyces sp. NPDC001698]|uniref:hypothetical protein n=1 Tax=unclassified Streptomyces TaxID=2593676 RepID=UPI00369AE56E
MSLQPLGVGGTSAAGDSFRTPAQTDLSGDEFRLYELVWMRTIASQMKDAVGKAGQRGGPPTRNTST